MNSEHRWMPTRARAEGVTVFWSTDRHSMFQLSKLQGGRLAGCSGVADKSLSRGESGGLFINHVTV